MLDLPGAGEIAFAHRILHLDAGAIETLLDAAGLITALFLDLPGRRHLVRAFLQLCEFGFDSFEPIAGDGIVLLV